MAESSRDEKRRVLTGGKIVQEVVEATGGSTANVKCGEHVAFLSKQ